MRTTITVKVLTPVLAAGVLLGLVGCATTRQVPEEKQSGFLGDYSLLRKGGAVRNDYCYIDRSANWANYTKVFIKPIELWHSDHPESGVAKMSPEAQQTMLDSFHVALVDALTNSFQLVDHSGPDVLVVHAALTDARPSKPDPNLVSSVYMPLRVKSFGRRLITGSDIGVGEVVIEVELLDGQTSQRIAAAVDERAGPKALHSKFGGRWEDVKLAFDWWAQSLEHRLQQAKAGDFSTN